MLLAGDTSAGRAWLVLIRRSWLIYPFGIAVRGSSNHRILRLIV